MVETPDDITAQLRQYLSVNGVLNPHTALTTGDTFFTDGAAAADAALGAQFPTGLSHTLLNTAYPAWTHADVFTNFMQSSVDVKARLQKFIIVFVDGRCRPEHDGVPVVPGGDACEHGTFYMDAPLGDLAIILARLLLGRAFVLERARA